MESPSALPPPLPPPAFSSCRLSKTGFGLAVLVIAACAVFVVGRQTEHRVEREERVGPNRMLELMARYAVGVKGMLLSAGQSNADVTKAMQEDIGQFARTDEDGLRLLILKGWLADTWPTAADLNGFAAKDESLRADVAELEALKATQGKGDDEAWKALKQRHGWIADLARAQVLADDADERKVVMQQAMGTAMVLMGASFLGMIAVVAGLVVMIMAITRWRAGKLHLTLALRSRVEGGVLTEGFAIYLALFLFLPWLLRTWLDHLPHWAPYVPAIGALILGAVWPLLRGMKRPQWKAALGFHRGQGVLQEMKAGLLGWVAALPLLVAGMIAASWIMKFTGDVPSHPIVDVFAGDGWAKFGAIILAVVWAPVSEEVMFRGLLFPGLSAWMRWLAGLLLSAFVFAVIHPQGWAGVPAIMALAGTFSLLRMWRHSLIAPMTAHALNNGIMCLMMLLLW
ncbi:type II CAAX endopeptidase family protein [Prosthecobacter sp.]|uniref:CPBP family intramembrane glutamic endopeptidase n=1 Tax=Prosthecobacter sp. TaxID=1965333 RepID=UPI001DAB0D6B|nr:type II CAAX endopeptidase family protein [Prosthecobacter sp.]MCB1275905.1 CPBP family intramembrane metalloprotease [Prosthecobacter sp.]